MSRMTMNSVVTSMTILLLLTGFSITLSEEPEVARPVERTSESEARRQAELLYGTIHPTLQIVHHRYYREDEGLRIPAATLKEVFAVLEKEQKISVRWLVVEGQAMNTDHVAKTVFEKEAVNALKAGKEFHEENREGVYRRASPITLGNDCLKCHVPDRRNTASRTAGLIISIPLTEAREN